VWYYCSMKTILKWYYFTGVFLAVLLPLSFAAAQTASFSLSVYPLTSTIAQGGQTSTSINVTGITDAYNTPVTLAVSQGLPAGVWVEFNPWACSPPCNSIMVVHADATAPPGTYVIPIIGAAVGQTAATSFTITIYALPKFDYSISLTSSRGSAATGERVDTTLNLNQLSGTSDSVVLSASGQPSGISVEFNPVSCSPPCSSLVSFNISSVTAGTYPITLSATAGSLTKTTTYDLTILPLSLADFSISISPSSNTIMKKESVNTLINLTRLSGTSQNVNLAVVNQPTSASIQVSPSSCQPPCNAVLSITTDENIKAGNYPIVVLGYAGGITKSVGYNLIITEPVPAVSQIPAMTFTPQTLPQLTGPFSFGMRSEQVRILQQYLNTDDSIGFPASSITGYYGPMTRAAVAGFQAKHNIEQTGLAGSITRAKLNALYGLSGTQTVQIQPAANVASMTEAQKQVLIQQLQQQLAILTQQLQEILKARGR